MQKEICFKTDFPNKSLGCICAEKINFSAKSDKFFVKKKNLDGAKRSKKSRCGEGDEKKFKLQILYKSKRHNALLKIHCENDILIFDHIHNPQ